MVLKSFSEYENACFTRIGHHCASESINKYFDRYFKGGDVYLLKAARN